jgi:hypothetical protein
MLGRSFRRALFALLFAAGPTACEMVFDFDRTPLQPVYEAGSPDAGDGGKGSG